MSGSSNPIADLQFYQPPNLLQQAGQVGQLQNLLLNNQQTQKTLAANVALGRDYQSSIDPKTGQFDPSTFAQIVKNDPNASYEPARVFRRPQLLSRVRS